MLNYTTIWLIVGIILLLSEFLIPGFTIFFFGVGAILTSVLLLFIPSLEDIIWIQIIIFLTISILSLIFLRRYFKKSLKGELFKENKDYIGQECKVIEMVTKEKPGRILYQGTTWNAYSTDEKIKKNQKATIVKKKDGEPMVFIIKKCKVKEK